MTSALIGHTGFVGQNLASQTRFDALFNSQNIAGIAGGSYDLVVCCGVRAEKWKANQDPAADRAGILSLVERLRTIRARRFVLISTVDVYARPVAVDETSAVDADGATPYGQHRHQLEQWIEGRFDALVVRLPGLFGPGLKKNVIFDLLNNNCLDQVHSEARYQFYDLSHLWQDIQIARAAGLRRINVATEPLSVAELARDVFSRKFCQAPHDRPASYDFRSRHAALYGGDSGYLYDRRTVLDQMRTFVRSEQERN